MTDRKLLELAAKAIGLKHRPENNCVVVDAKTGQWLGSWNPLTDDGDALRLAVNLRFDVRFTEISGMKEVEVHGPWDGWFSEEIGDDPYAATRRAIARAAAEIGRGM